MGVDSDASNGKSTACIFSEKDYRLNTKLNTVWIRHARCILDLKVRKGDAFDITSSMAGYVITKEGAPNQLAQLSPRGLLHSRLRKVKIGTNVLCCPGLHR